MSTDKTYEEVEKEQAEILQRFKREFIDKQEDIDPRFSDLVDKHFWGL